MATNLGALASNQPVTLTFRTTQTWAVAGEIKVQSGDFDAIPAFLIQEAPNQTTKITKVWGIITGGTSVTCKLQKWNADITGFTGMVITPNSGFGVIVDPADQDVADGDKINLVVTAVSGTPVNFSLTVALEHTVIT